MNRIFNPNGRIGRWLASSIKELAVAWWTCTSFYLMYATGGRNEFMLFIPLALGAPLFLGLTWRKPVIAQVDPLVTTGVFMLFISIVGSYMFNAEFYEPIIMAGNMASAMLLFFELYLIVMKMELDFRKLLVYQAIYINIFLPVVLYTSSDVWGRLEPAELHPNYVSMMGIVAVIGALSARNIVAAAALAVLPIYTMVRMESRASMIATAAAVAIIIGCELWQRRSRKLVAQLGVASIFGGAACVGAALLGFNIFGYIGDTVTKVLMLDDNLRGVNSGASGRSDLWSAAFHLWTTHPIFGVGFKGHMQFMPDHMVAHNAFLGLLADNGIVGLVGYLLIIGVSAAYIVRRGSKGLTMFGQRAAVIFPYFLYGMVESRAFSFGNAYSVLFLLVAFDSAKYRVARPRAKSPPVSASTPVPEPRREQQVGTLYR